MAQDTASTGNDGNGGVALSLRTDGNLDDPSGLAALQTMGAVDGTAPASDASSFPNDASVQGTTRLSNRGENPRLQDSDRIDDTNGQAGADAASSTDTDGSDGGSTSRPFDVFAGPQQLSGQQENSDSEALRALPAGSANEPAGSQTQGSQDLPSRTQASGDEDAARPIRAAATNSAQQPFSQLARPANPPLAAGIAGEALGSASPLRLNQPLRTIDQAAVRDGADPFAAVGIRLGTFVLYPELVQSLGYSTNLDQLADGASGTFSQTTVSARLLSDWSRNESELNGSFTYRRNFAGEIEEDPSGSLDGRLGVDIDRLTSATLRAALDFRRENPADLSVAERGFRARQPRVLTYSGTAQVTRALGPIDLTASATAAREQYDEEPVGNLDQNTTTLTATLRTSYRLSDALKPFIETSLGRRLYDQESGVPGGADRDAVLPSARAGVTIDLLQKLSGEAAVGYAWNVPDADRGEVVSSPTLDTSLIWSPARGTNVTLAARTTFDPQSDGLSTTTRYDTSLQLRQVVTNRLDVTSSAGVQYNDSTLASNDETYLTAAAGFNYWLNRDTALTGDYDYRQLFSDIAGLDYRAHTVQFGVRLQR